MPLQTAMNQFAGTGSAGLNRGMPGAMTPPPPPRNPAADAQLAWNAKFGPFTPTQVGQQREAGQPVGQAPTLGTGTDVPAQNPEGPAGAVAADTRTPGGPGMAGGAGANTEAAFPGFFRGTPEPGISKQEQGIGTAPGSDVTGQIGKPPGPGGKGRLAQAMGSPTDHHATGLGAPSATGTPLTAAPPPQVPGAVDPAATAVLATQQSPELAAGQQVVAGSGTNRRLAVEPATGQGQPTSDAPIGATDAGATTTDASATPRGWHGTDYVLNDGAKIPPAFSSWPTKKQQAWMDANAKPASQLQYDANQALGDYRNKDVKLPGQDPNGPDPVVVKLGMTANEIGPIVGNDPALMNYAQAVLRMNHDIDQALQDTSFMGGGAARDKYLREKYAQKTAVQKALAGYGVYFEDNAPPPPTTGGGDTGGGGGGTGDTGGGGGGDTGGGDTGGGDAGGGNPLPDTPFTPIDTPVNDYEHTGLQGDPQNPGSLTDISTLQDSFQKRANYWMSQGLSPDKAMLYAELDLASSQQQNMDNNRQQQIDLLSRGMSDYVDSPLYTGIQKSALEQLNQGDPTDWEGIKNRRASDAAKDVAATRDTLSTAGARRGLSPGAIAGIGTRAATDSRMGLSRALGELDVQQAQSGRDYAERGLKSGMAGLASTTNENMRNLFNLGSIIGGNQQDYGNPSQGAAAGYMNIEAAQAKLQAAEDAGGATWGDIAAIGGIIAAPFTGGASLALTTAAAGKGPAI